MVSHAKYNGIYLQRKALSPIIQCSVYAVKLKPKTLSQNKFKVNLKFIYYIMIFKIRNRFKIG